MQQTARIQLQELRIFCSFRWCAVGSPADANEEALYDSIDPFGPEMLELDKRNFQIRRSNVDVDSFTPHIAACTPY